MDVRWCDYPFRYEAADIKGLMQEYGETSEQQKAIGAWLCDYVESR